MNHTIDKHGEFCSCGQDACTCQKCGRRVCGSLTKWIDGKGNVCKEDCMPVRQKTARQEYWDNWYLRNGW